MMPPSIPTPQDKFRRRILIVDGDAAAVAQCAAVFGERSYEVRTAGDGFQALQVLRGAPPDLLISELDLPRMSGFELLSIVRLRFPQVSVIASSDEFNTVSLPRGTLADVFVAKGPEFSMEIGEAALELLQNPPLRMGKPEVAAVWVPRSAAGYIVLTCPECLRSFPAAQGEGESSELRTETCPSCGTSAKFRLTSMPTPPVRPSATERMEEIRDRAQRSVAASEHAITSSKELINYKLKRRH